MKGLVLCDRHGAKPTFECVWCPVHVAAIERRLADGTIRGRAPRLRAAEILLVFAASSIHLTYERKLYAAELQRLRDAAIVYAAVAAVRTGSR